MFFRNFVTINCYAVFSTLIAGLVFSVMFWQGSILFSSYPFEYITSLQFGFFISAVDPVATISIFRALNVNESIFTIVFGESMLNDAAAIALSKSAEGVGEAMEEGEFDLSHAMGGAFYEFLIYFFVSLIIGGACGIIFSVCFKILELHTIPWIEIGLFALASYFPFVLAEWVGCSGILAILILAIVMRNYAYFSMSPFG